MTGIHTLSQALEESEPLGQRHLLLGNGFSISRFPETFSYRSLLEKANFPPNSKLPDVFEALDTQDFELVMRRLDETRDLMSIYGLSGSSDSISDALSRDRDSLRNTLISAIVENHPATPEMVDEEQFGRCQRFLSKFLAEGNGHVFTLNYDLLLYWALMHPPNGPMGNDGFLRSDSDSPLLWIGDRPDSRQNVHYLHGALHLFVAGDTVEKLTSANRGKRILDQVTTAIRSGKFPVFVTEGKSEHKLRKVRLNPYLETSYRSFRDVTREQETVLFVFGHSLSDQDDHILKQIVRGSFRHLFVSVREGSGGDAQDVIARARALAQQRKGPSLEVHYFAAESASLWNKT